MNSTYDDDMYCPQPSDTAYGNGPAFAINTDGTTQSPFRSASDPCVVTCDGPEDDYTLYPHPNDCARYCQCKNGMPLNMACPDGLEFDPIPHRCEYPTHFPDCQPACPPTVGAVVDHEDIASGEILQEL